MSTEVIEQNGAQIDVQADALERNGFDPDRHDLPPGDVELIGSYADKGEGYAFTPHPTAADARWCAIRKRDAARVEAAVQEALKKQGKQGGKSEDILTMLNLKPSAPAAASAMPVAQQSVDEIAQSLGLRRSYKIKERGAEVYSSWVAYDGQPVFLVELDDPAKQYHSEQLQEIARLRIDLEKPPQFSNETDTEKVMKEVEGALTEKVTMAESLLRREAELTAWVLEQAWRGSPLAADWRELYPSQQHDIARLFIAKSSMQRIDTALF